MPALAILALVFGLLGWSAPALAGGTAPDLFLNKIDGGTSIPPGGFVNYTLMYANSGSAMATGLVLTETVPANTTFRAAGSSVGWSCLPDNSAGSICTRAVGSLPPGGDSSAQFSVTVVNPLPAGVTEISNTASIADDGTHGPDPTPANNSDTETTPISAGNATLTDIPTVSGAGLAVLFSLLALAGWRTLRRAG